MNTEELAMTSAFDAARLKLTPSDFRTETGLRMTAYCERRVAMLAEQLQGPLNKRETNDIRSRINEIRELMALANEPVETEGDD